MEDEKELKNLTVLSEVHSKIWGDVDFNDKAQKMKFILFLWEVELEDFQRKSLWSTDLSQVQFMVDEIKEGRSDNIDESVADNVLKILEKYFESLFDDEKRKEFNIEGRFKEFSVDPDYLRRVEVAENKPITITPINVKRR